MAPEQVIFKICFLTRRSADMSSSATKKMHDQRQTRKPTAVDDNRSPNSTMEELITTEEERVAPSRAQQYEALRKQSTRSRLRSGLRGFIAKAAAEEAEALSAESAKMSESTPEPTEEDIHAIRWHQYQALKRMTRRSRIKSGFLNFVAKDAAERAYVDYSGPAVARDDTPEEESPSPAVQRWAVVRQGMQGGALAQRERQYAALRQQTAQSRALAATAGITAETAAESSPSLSPTMSSDAASVMQITADEPEWHGQRQKQYTALRKQVAQSRLKSGLRGFINTDTAERAAGVTQATAEADAEQATETSHMMIGSAQRRCQYTALRRAARRSRLKSGMINLLAKECVAAFVSSPSSIPTMPRALGTPSVLY